MDNNSHNSSFLRFARLFLKTSNLKWGALTVFFRKPLASSSENESYFFRPELFYFSNFSAMLMGFDDF